MSLPQLKQQPLSKNSNSRAIARSTSLPQSTGSSGGQKSDTPSFNQPPTTKLTPQPSIHKIRTSHLKATVISYSLKAQAEMEALQLPWGIQYELARGVCAERWTWQDVRSKLHLFKDFRTNTAGAYRVAWLMLGTALPPTVDLGIWEELDREQLAILENRGRGLGLQGDWQGAAEWYGGRVQQIVRFKTGSDGSLTLELLPLEKRRSFRFARFAGSRRILILRRPKDLTLSMEEMLCGKFVLCGRVFVPFHTKDTSTYMVEVDEDDYRCKSLHEGDALRMPLRVFIRAFNDLDLNKDQPISKWTARFDLSASNSIPVLEFEEENIIYIDDIYSPDWSKEGKPPAEMVMTDGAGLINRSALAIITHRLSLGLPPAAVQGRIAGAKGLWILHLTDDSPEPKIWIRQSQNKIKLRTPEEYKQTWHHRAHTIFDFLCASHAGNIAYISPQSIANLSHNGVSDDILCSLMMAGLRLDVEPFLNWTQPNAGPILWNTVNAAGRVGGSRLQRLAKEKARALGFQQKSFGDEYADNDLGVTSEIDIQENSYQPAAETDGAPKSLYEQAIELLQAGFLPQTSMVLCSKFKSMVRLVVENSTKGFRIPIQRSTQAFIVPDSTGLLREDQIYYRSSVPIVDADSQTAFHVLTGEALIGRYPLRVASDIRRVTAVDIPELSRWSDVIVLPTVSFQSLASYLSGGDHDGDTAFLLWETALLGAFKQPDLVPPPANLLTENFHEEVQTVVDFCQTLQTTESSDSMQQSEFQKNLLNSCLDPRVGLYSKFHERAVYMFGYDSPEAERLGHIFNYVLDGRKSGLHLKRKVFELDSKKYSKPLPVSFDSTPRDMYAVCAARDPARDLPRFILEVLADFGEVQKKFYLDRFHDISPKGIQEKEQRDTQLLNPYDEALRIAKAAQTAGFPNILHDLKTIETHVTKSKEKWTTVVMQKDNDKLLAETYSFYAQHPPTTFIPNAEEVKASYAYKLCADRKTYFAFSVAFEELCMIKARASPGGIAPCQRTFDQVKFISSAAIRVLATSEDLR